MAKNNRKYQNPLNDIKNIEIPNDFEDFGYDVQNAKRYTVRNKRPAKFKDYDDYVDWGDYMIWAFNDFVIYLISVYILRGLTAPFFIYTLRALYSILQVLWMSNTVPVPKVAHRGL